MCIRDSGLLNRLRGGNITLGELEPVVARMARLAERAGGIIKRVNAFARRRELSRQRLDVVAVLRRVLAGTGEAQNRQASLLEKNRSIWIDADELLLEHLINKLVANALDWAHLGAGSAQVRVEVDCDRPHGLA